MKTRNGFVSNSSSSSFVVIVTKSIFEEALTQIKDERCRKILKGVSTEQKGFGKDLVVVQEMSDNGGFSNLFGDGEDFDYESMGLTYEEMHPEDDEDDEFYPSECLYQYEKVLNKLQENKNKENDIFILDSMGSG